MTKAIVSPTTNTLCHSPITDERHLSDVARQMREHYQRTGKYRAEDLIRILGDPTKGVVVGP